MIEEQGSIVAVEGDYAWVESARRSSCGSCSAKGCGTGALDKVFGRKIQRIRVRNAIAAPVGAQVVLGIEEGAFLQGSVAVYIFPLVTMFALALLAEVLLAPGSDLLVALAGLCGLGLGLLALKGVSERVAHARRFQAIVLRRVEPKNEFKVNTYRPMNNQSDF